MQHDYDLKEKRQPRENLRELLIAEFDPMVERNRGRPNRKRTTFRIARSLVLGSASSFFVGVFAGVATGAVIGYAGVHVYNLFRLSINATLPGLPAGAAMPATTYLIATMLGGIIGLWIGCVLFAPALEARREPRGRYGRNPLQ
jgi:hypothetical protein